MHLDGLIAWAVKEEALRNASGSTATGAEPDYAAFISDLPLEKHESPHGWCWQASKLEVVGYRGQERRYLTAKTPVLDMALAIGNRVVEEKGGSTIDTVRGLGKNAAMYYTLEHAQGFEAYCVGDYDALSELLQEIQAIGAKTRLGHGSLRPYDDGNLFRITHDPTAHEKWKRRNAPERLLEDMIPAVASFQPPYWKGKDYCWVPAP
ncbi:hypothetical protein OX89_04045 [Diaphorobacter sp. J5-51]|nr:hypothetical protein OX89_04045 [Diaphorobacter sp. J5-51]